MHPKHKEFVIYQSPSHGEMIGVFDCETPEDTPAVYFFHDNPDKKAVGVFYDPATITGTGIICGKDDIEDFMLFDYAVATFLVWCRMTGREHLEGNFQVKYACGLALARAGIARRLAEDGLDTLPAHRENIIAICIETTARVLDFTDTLHHLRTARANGKLVLQ